MAWLNNNNRFARRWGFHMVGDFIIKSIWINLENIWASLVAQWRRWWHPTPVLLPGKSHGRRSLVGCSPWGCEESDTTERLHFDFSLSCIGEGMATHSSVLAWRIPGTGEPGGLPSMGLHRVRHNWSDLAAAGGSDSKESAWNAVDSGIWSLG